MVSGLSLYFCTMVGEKNETQVRKDYPCMLQQEAKQTMQLKSAAQMVTTSRVLG